MSGYTGPLTLEQAVMMNRLYRMGTMGRGVIIKLGPARKRSAVQNRCLMSLFALGLCTFSVLTADSNRWSLTAAGLLRACCRPGKVRAGYKDSR